MAEGAIGSRPSARGGAPAAAARTPVAVDLDAPTVASRRRAHDRRSTGRCAASGLLEPRGRPRFPRGGDSDWRAAGSSRGRRGGSLFERLVATSAPGEPGLPEGHPSRCVGIAGSRLWCLADNGRARVDRCTAGGTRMLAGRIECRRTAPGVARRVRRPALPAGCRGLRRVVAAGRQGASRAKSSTVPSPRPPRGLGTSALGRALWSSWLQTQCLAPPPTG
ncbi:MAG: hypothetical protein BWX48_01373 [Verrucomicrobia bacterium ADurb.Bin006]|nr:MAG: hypothetical protein BWX48_01373 [Verrucomicrobia bacterium ADurb.Bin006]